MITAVKSVPIPNGATFLAYCIAKSKDPTIIATVFKYWVKSAIDKNITIPYGIDNLLTNLKAAGSKSKVLTGLLGIINENQLIGAKTTLDVGFSASGKIHLLLDETITELEELGIFIPSLADEIGFGRTSINIEIVREKYPKMKPVKHRAALLLLYRWFKTNLMGNFEFIELGAKKGRKIEFNQIKLSDREEHEIFKELYDILQEAWRGKRLGGNSRQTIIEKEYILAPRLLAKDSKPYIRKFQDYLIGNVAYTRTRKEREQSIGQLKGLISKEIEEYKLLHEALTIQKRRTNKTKTRINMLTQIKSQLEEIDIRFTANDMIHRLLNEGGEKGDIASFLKDKDALFINPHHTLDLETGWSLNRPANIIDHLNFKFKKLRESPLDLESQEKWNFFYKKLNELLDHFEETDKVTWHEENVMRQISRVLTRFFLPDMIRGSDNPITLNGARILHDAYGDQVNFKIVEDATVSPIRGIRDFPLDEIICIEHVREPNKGKRIYFLIEDKKGKVFTEGAADFGSPTTKSHVKEINSELRNIVAMLTGKHHKVIKTSLLSHTSLEKEDLAIDWSILLNWLIRYGESKIVNAFKIMLDDVRQGNVIDAYGMLRAIGYEHTSEIYQYMSQTNRHKRIPKAMDVYIGMFQAPGQNIRSVIQQIRLIPGYEIIGAQLLQRLENIETKCERVANIGSSVFFDLQSITNTDGILKNIKQKPTNEVVDQIKTVLGKWEVCSIDLVKEKQRYHSFFQENIVRKESS
ncbi:MAG: hypothetical protein ACE5OZ_12745 [Candidatus Heimdallarchaeota archaeon]